ncbi:MAG: hypothetical protein GF401_11590 [Chitinivibrionales bacterium]|nr:hypothetical protein [Chitinivibrionales bacterium]
MFEIVEKAIYAGIGAAYMAKEKVEEMGKKIAEDTNMSEAEGKKFVEELKKRSSEARLAMEKSVSETMEKTLKRLDIPTRKEISSLENRLSRLEKDVDDEKEEKK